MATPLLSLTADELREAARAAVGQGAGVAYQVHREALLRGCFAPESFGVSARAEAAWREAFCLDLPKVEARQAELHPEHANQTAKVALRFADGLEVEMVRVPKAKGAYSLCISTQVGCKMGCAFCETAKLGLLRNLSAAEIVAQVVVAQVVLGWQIRNVVFMGMGEPLDNVAALKQSLRVLSDRRGLSFSQQRLRICTAGHVTGLQALFALGWRRLELSVSLNAADDALRDRLMPINRRFKLAALQETLKNRPFREHSVLAVNYALIPGVNDRPEDAEGVAAFCAPLGRLLLNLIPYNPGSQPLGRAPTDDEVDRFTEALKAHGVPVHTRAPRGRSVMAACGQLGNKALRSRKRQAEAL